MKRTAAGSGALRAWWALLLVAAVLGASGARAQELEPRAYSNAPIGLNFMVAGYVYTNGSVSFDPAVPIEDAKLHTNNALVAYARVFDFLGCSAKFDAVVPYTWLNGSGEVAGQTRDRVIDGMADPRFRVQVNFLGAPALEAKDYGSYHQDLIVGASLQVFVPLGQYDETRLINIGTNRWAFKPEIGVSKQWGSWILEIAPSVTFYRDNDNFMSGKTLEQRPLYAVQAHLVYSLPRGIWASLDGSYYAGARTVVDGEESDNYQINTRLGLTVAIPVTRNHSVKLYGSTGVTSRTGTSFDAVGAAWQYRWGGGF